MWTNGPKNCGFYETDKGPRFLFEKMSRSLARFSSFSQTLKKLSISRQYLFQFWFFRQPLRLLP